MKFVNSLTFCVIYILFYSLASKTRIDAVECWAFDCKEIFIAMVVFLCFTSYILHLQPNLTSR